MGRISRRGSVSVFAALILVPLIAFGGMIADIALVKSADRIAKGALDLSLGSVLSQYDRDLFERYGLFESFAASASGSEAGADCFDKTVSADGLFDLTDGYARGLLNRLFGSAAVAGGNGRYGLINLKRTSYSVRSVPESCLGNPPVLERQILDYMKYRGLLTGAAALAEKLGIIGHIGESSRAVSSKIKYESKLGRLQSAADSLCDATDSFFEGLDASGFAFDVAHGAEELCREALESAASGACDGAAADFTLAMSGRISSGNCTAGGFDPSAPASCREALARLEEDEGYRYIKIAANNSRIDRLFTAGAFVRLIADGEEKIALASAASAALSRLPEKERTQFDPYETGKTVSLITEKLRSAASVFENAALEKLTSAAATLESVREEANELARLAGDLSDAAKTFKETADSLYPELTKWQGDVEALPEGEIKRGMEEQIAAETVRIDAGAALLLSEEADRIKEELKKAASDLSALKICGVSICGFSKRDLRAFPEICPSGDAAAGAIAVPETPQMPRIHGIDGLKSSNGRLGSFLDELFAARSEGETNAACDGIKDKIYSMALEESGADGDVSRPSRISEAGGECFRLIAFYASSADYLEDFLTPSASLCGSDASELTESAAGSVASTGGFLSSAAQILSRAGDDMLVSGYLCGVFSCSGDERGDVNLITGCDYSSSVFFGREIEYLIFGKDYADDNLSLAAASVFGIRFALNTIYALTDPYLNETALTAATAIAGWSGFGVPVVQNLLLVAMSLAESISDVARLMKGHSVALWKNPEVWKCDVGGIIGSIAGSIGGESDSGTVCLSFRDYMTALLAACYPFGRTKILSRAAKLIQINMSNLNPSFVITAGGTLFTAEAEVSVGGTFSSALGILPRTLPGIEEMSSFKCSKAAGY